VSRIAETFKTLRQSGRKGLIVYITGGYPDFDATLTAVLTAEKAGADLIEIGIPFSDPMADGPVIQKVASYALKTGATTAKAVELVKRIRAKTNIPLLAMTYINPILQYGVQSFMQDFVNAGLDGIIVPDVPSEEAALIEEPCRQAGMDFISFVAPTTNRERIAVICKQASGFIYCVSTTGVTGVREVDYSKIGNAMQIVKEYTDTPMAIGFGIGSPEAARQAAAYGDAVIVGSAVMQKLKDSGINGVRDIVQSIRQGLDEERV